MPASVTQAPVNAIQTYITEQVVSHLKADRVVVWYDPREEFRPYLQEILGRDPVGDPEAVLQPARFSDQAAQVVVFAGSFLEVRLAVESHFSASQPDPLLIYLPGQSYDRKNSLLLELECAGRTYEPTLRRLARNVLCRRYTDGVVDELLGPPNLTYQDIVRVLEDDREPETASVLRMVYPGAHTGEALLAAWLADPGRDSDLQAKEAGPELFKLAASVLGIDLPGDLDLALARTRTWRFVLAGDLRASLPEEHKNCLSAVPSPPNVDRQKGTTALAKRLRQESPEAYVMAADQVEAELGLAAAGLPPLVSSETFRFSERTLLAHVHDLIAQKRESEAAPLVEAASDTFWARRETARMAEWEVARILAELRLLARAVKGEAESQGSDPASWIQAYTRSDGWHRLDQLHRTLEARVALLDEDMDEDNALIAVRQSHEDAIRAMATGFAGALQKAQWNVSGTLPQTKVYDDRVAGLPGPVAMFLVDSMRYEMGVELGSLLGEVEDLIIEPAIAALPTITPVGMAALLPGASESFSVIESKGKLASRIEGTPLPDLNARRAFLKSRVPGVVDIELGAVLERTTSKLRAALKDAPLIVVRSQDIDLIGESGQNYLARQIMGTLLGNVARAVRRLAAVGVGRFVISADHGHQFATDKGEDMRTDAPGGQTVDLHRRCWIGRGGAAPQGIIRVTGAELGYDTDLDFVFPIGLGIFKAGGDTAYHHGGISLQEMIVPVLSFRVPIEDTAADMGFKLVLGDVPTALSNRTFGFTVGAAGLFGAGLAIRPVLLDDKGQQVGAAGMAVGAEYDRLTGTIKLGSEGKASVGMMLTRDDCTQIRLIVQDATTDAVLAQSAFIPVSLKT